MDKTNNMRTNLKVFRVKHNLTQEEISKKIGCIRPTYSAIENGKREGRKTFWNDLQLAFELTDEQIQELMKVD